MAIVNNEYFDGMPSNYSQRYFASKGTIGTETKMRDTGNKPLYKRYIAYTQRKGIVTVLLLFILLTVVGIILSSNYEPFNPAIFNDFASYRAYQPVLPRIETVLQDFSGFADGMTITEFMNQTLITGNWSIFEPLRSLFNVISRPFVFVYALIVNLFEMLTMFINVFI